MARKQRNNVDYFPHSVTHGKKMFYLRDKFNNDGYAVWFMLLEELGKAEYHYLDLQDEIQLMYLSSAFKVSEKVLNEIIETLVKFGEFDKDLWVNEKILFNEKFIENISDAYKKRNNNCINKYSLILLLNSKGRLIDIISNPKQGISNPKQGISPSEVVGNTQSKVKDSKVKDSKVNKTIKEVVEINFNYSVIDFLTDWNLQREKHLKKPSFLNSLGNDELLNFKDLAKDYKKDDFNYALVGLFKQKKLPNGNTQMQSNPKHFLSHFNSYLTAYHDKNNSLYGKEINIAKTI